MIEIWKGVSVRYDLLPIGTRRTGQAMAVKKPVFIVAHDTGNINTTAQNNVDYYKNTYNIDWASTASAHIFVDDKEAIICIPTTEKAWHVLYNTPIDDLWYGINANDGAIGVEICYFSDKERSKKSLDNGARVLAYLAEYWGVDYKTNMPGHQDIQSDKQDPGNLLEACGLGRNTSNLDKEVAKYYKKVIKSVDVKKSGNAEPRVKTQSTKTMWSWKGTFYPDRAIKVRKSPGLKGTIVNRDSWLYDKDDWVEFDQVIKADGYWWIRFKYPKPGSSKNYFYCAVCEITDKQERIKKEKYFGKIDWK
ncbi:N-acetylmuramoyl-L-alanine amidase [Staphylococcus phage SAPYZU_15]|nr:N-acetylmuramoyl-L-alanine amidase [Staphylococcus phage SAPYZU_15]